MNLKKLTSLALISGTVALAACGGSVTEVEQFSPNDFKPPMGLSAIAGNEAVTLTWQAANSPDDEIELGGFAVYMVEGDLTGEANASEPVPAYTDEENFPGLGGRDAQGFGPSPDAFVVINGTAAAESMATGVGVSLIDATVPGVVVYQVKNGDPRPDFDEGDPEDPSDDCLVGVDDCGAEGTTPAADDAAADDAAADDAAADDAAAFSAAQTAPDDGTGSVTDDSGGTVALANGTEYSFTVAARDVDFTGQSFCSNIAATAPRGEITGVTMTASDATTNGLDIEAGIASAFGAHDGEYVETDGTGETDIVIESVGSTGGFYTPGAANYFAGCNGSSIQDVGYVDSWDEVGAAPGGGYLGGGRSVLVVAGHLYVVSVADGTFAKVLVTASDATAQTVSVDIAHQTGATVYFK